MIDGNRNTFPYHTLIIPFMMRFFLLLLTKNGPLPLSHYLMVKLLAFWASHTNFSNIFLTMLQNISKKSSRFVLLLHIYLQNGKKLLFTLFRNLKNGTVT